MSAWDAPAPARRGYRMVARASTTALAVIGSWACSAAQAGGSAGTGALRAFEMLEGDWGGDGTLFGRPARFSMTWTAMGDGRYRLDFTNGMIDEAGRVTPVLSAVAIYSPRADGTATAEWTDDRPQEITILAQVSDSVVVSDWTAPAESGRTEYRVALDGTVRVRDWVRSDGALRPFGEAVYRRR